VDVFPLLTKALAPLAAWPDLCRDLRGLALREGEGVAVDLAITLARCAVVYEDGRRVWGWGPVIHAPGEVRPGKPEAGEGWWLGVKGKTNTYPVMAETRPDGAYLWTRPGLGHWRRV